MRERQGEREQEEGGGGHSRGEAEQGRAGEGTRRTESERTRALPIQAHIAGESGCVHSCVRRVRARGRAVELAACCAALPSAASRRLSPCGTAVAAAQMGGTSPNI